MAERYTARGKVVCGGEYAVLDRGIVTVFPLAKGWIDAIDSDQWSLRCAFANGEQELAADDPVQKWFERLKKQFPNKACAKLRIDTSQLYRPDGSKWGLGSSGVARVLLYRFFAEWPDSTDLDQHLKILNALARDAGELGSGVDRLMAVTGQALSWAPQSRFQHFSPFGRTGYLLPAAETVATEDRLTKLPQQDGQIHLKGKTWQMARDSSRATSIAACIGNYSQFLASLKQFDIALESALQSCGLSRFDDSVTRQQKTWQGWYVRPCGAGGDAAIALPLNHHSAVPSDAQQSLAIAL